MEVEAEAGAEAEAEAEAVWVEADFAFCLRLLERGLSLLVFERLVVVLRVVTGAVPLATTLVTDQASRRVAAARESVAVLVVTLDGLLPEQRRSVWLWLLRPLPV